MSLPATTAAGLVGPIGYAESTDWELRWTRSAPPPVAGEDDVTFLDGSAAEVGDFLESAYPAAEGRPGDPDLRQWAVIRDRGGAILACAADGTRHGTGRLSAIATAPAARGRGLGAAVTAALTRRLFTEVDLVVLGLYLWNDNAQRLYARLGFGDTMTVRSGITA